MTVAIGLSLASLILLIYFIHHVSSSIQASKIVQVIADDMQGAIPKLYPSETGDPIENRDEGARLRERGEAIITIRASGYLQTVDSHELLAIATDEDLAVELTVKPGDHLIEGYQVARIWGTQKPPEKILKRIRATFLLGGERTPTQDIRYQFQQLTDVVVRALSPGINDPFTAINGIDELASAMALFSKRARVAEKRQGGDGVLRLVLPTPSVSEVLEETVGHIAIYASGDKFVMAGLRRVLDVVERSVPTQREMATLLRLRKDLDWREQASLAETVK